MEFEHGPKKVNEYNQRPVLPDPLAVAGAKVKIVQAKSKPQSQPVKANEKTGIVKKLKNNLLGRMHVTERAEL